MRGRRRNNRVSIKAVYQAIPDKKNGGDEVIREKFTGCINMRVCRLKENSETKVNKLNIPYPGPLLGDFRT